MRTRLALGCLKLAHSELAVVSLLPHAPRARRAALAPPQDTRSPKPLDRGHQASQLVVSIRTHPTNKFEQSKGSTATLFHVQGLGLITRRTGAMCLVLCMYYYTAVWPIAWAGSTKHRIELIELDNFDWPSKKGSCAYRKAPSPIYKVL